MGNFSNGYYLCSLQSLLLQKKETQKNWHIQAADKVRSTFSDCMAKQYCRERAGLVRRRAKGLKHCTHPDNWTDNWTGNIISKE